MRQMRLSHRSHKQDEAPPASARPTLGPSQVDAMSLQGSIGNAAVGNLVRSRERAMTESPTPVDGFTQSLIAGQAGGPEMLPGMQGGARIHHGPQSDLLARRLGATAFTQGNDVFLRSDRHPASEAGQATLAHELTHVALGSVGPGAVMREPDVDEAVPMDSGQRPARIPSAVARIELEKAGPVKGNSKVAGHEGEIEIDSFQFGSTGPVNTTGQKTRDITITKAADEASALLARAVASGERVVGATFTFIKRKDDGTTENGLVLEFKDGFITSYSTGVSGDAPMESMTFQFDANGGRT